MRRALLLLAAVLGAWFMSAPAPAHADYFSYPCTYPFVGAGAEVQVGVSAGGQFCDGPMEINGSHYHCESGQGNVGIGAIGLSPLSGGLTFGGLGGGGLGGGGGVCQWRCPDNTPSPRAPNPPAAWIQPLKVDEKNNDCRDHMTPNGPWSTPQGATPAGLPPGEVEPGVAGPPPPPDAAPPPPPGNPMLTPGSPIALP